MSVDREGLVEIAEQCVGLVAEQFDERLDWTVDSLARLDEVCARLLDDGSLSAERFDLWWKLIGPYVGEVTIRAYGGEWVEHERARGAYAIRVLSMTGFPFATTARVLQGEDFKSLASFARSSPAIAARSTTAEQDHSTRGRRWRWSHKRR